MKQYESDTQRVGRMADLNRSTRRAERLERIATAALQGLCANSYDGHQNRPLATASYAEMAECAVGHAKALITELDKQA